MLAKSQLGHLPAKHSVSTELNSQPSYMLQSGRTAADVPQPCGLTRRTLLQELGVFKRTSLMLLTKAHVNSGKSFGDILDAERSTFQKSGLATASWTQNLLENPVRKRCQASTKSEGKPTCLAICLTGTRGRWLNAFSTSATHPTKAGLKRKPNLLRLRVGKKPNAGQFMS